MSNNVEVINKAGKDLDVTINNVDGGIRIVIDIKKIDIDLLSLNVGDIFEINDIEYIVL